MNFDAFVNDILSNQWNIFGVEVWQDGRLAHTFGDTQTHRHNLYSATKSITSIAAGMALDAGRIDLDRCVLDYLPLRAVIAMPPHQRDAWQPVTLRRLMTMSVAGFPFRPEGESWLAASLGCPLTDTATPLFSYSNIPTYLVCVALTHALDEPLGDFLTRRLYQPLCIPRPPMMHCPDGYFYGASGTELTVNELSRIGLLMQCGGVFDGQRLLSEAYVRQATSVQQMNREGGYGFFIWKYMDGFSFNGKWKQKCYILPRRGLVITFLGHIEEDCPGLRASMERHLLGTE